MNEQKKTPPLDTLTQLSIAKLTGIMPDGADVDTLMAEWREKVILPFAAENPFTKADLASAKSNGESFAKNKTFWAKFDQLVEYFEQQGDPVRPEDLHRKVDANDTVFSLGLKAEYGEKLFLPAIWAGRLDDFTAQYFEMDKDQRTKYEYTALKIAIAAESGEEIREKVYADIGISVPVLQKALRTANSDLDKIFQKLDEAGVVLLPEDLLFVDMDGDTGYYGNPMWDEKLPVLFDYWRKHDVLPNADHFLERVVGNNKSPFAYACVSNDKTRRLFDPVLWYDQPDEMKKIYERLPDDRASAVNLNEVMDAIEQINYAKSIDMDSIHRDKLLVTLNDVSVDGYAIRPLGLDIVWDNIDDIRMRLAEAGTALTLDDLLQASGPSEEACIIHAFKNGQGQAVVDIAQDGGELFTAEHLLQADEQGNTVADLLVKNELVEQLLTVDTWVGHPVDFAEFCSLLPDSYRSSNADTLKKLLESINLATVQQNVLQVQAAANKLDATGLDRPSAP